MSQTRRNCERARKVVLFRSCIYCNTYWLQLISALHHNSSVQSHSSGGNQCHQSQDSLHPIRLFNSCACSVCPRVHYCMDHSFLFIKVSSYKIILAWTIFMSSLTLRESVGRKVSVLTQFMSSRKM